MVFGSIVLEDQAIKPLEPSEVVSYGDYEKEFINLVKFIA